MQLLPKLYIITDLSFAHWALGAHTYYRLQSAICLDSYRSTCTCTLRFRESYGNLGLYYKRRLRETVCLFGLSWLLPVNNFSHVGRSHHFLGINQYSGELVRRYLCHCNHLSSHVYYWWKMNEESESVRSILFILFSSWNNYLDTGMA